MVIKMEEIIGKRPRERIEGNVSAKCKESERNVRLCNPGR